MDVDLDLIIKKNKIMEKKIARDVKILKVYSTLLTLGIISFFIMSYVEGDKKEHFEEIDVERINIVESNGDLKMVISNQERQHPGIFRLRSAALNLTSL